MLSNETKELLIEIAETLPKIYEAGLAVPREVIYLTNGIRIEARENGVWLVDNEEEIHLYDSKWQQLQAQYSDCANEAEYAFYDSSGRELKGTTVEENGDEGYVNVTLYDGSIISYGVVDDIFIEIPEDELQVGYTSCVHFSTGSATTIDFTPASALFVGDSVINLTLEIKPICRYTIKFEYDGVSVIGYVTCIG